MLDIEGSPKTAAPQRGTGCAIVFSETGGEQAPPAATVAVSSSSPSFSEWHPSPKPEELEVAYLSENHRCLLIKLGLALCFATVVIVATVVSVFLSTADDGGGSSIHRPVLSVEERMAKIRPTVTALSDPTEFLRPDSPQSIALQFLVYRDRVVDVDDTEKLKQRYVVLLLLYSFESLVGDYEDLSECDMNGFSCNVEGKVTQVDLYNRFLVGQIPPELKHLTHLTVLDLAGNSLRGTIPDDLLFALTGLEKLDLSYNELSSKLNTAIGSLTSLRVLGLGDNRFTGTIPATFSQLTNLVEFSVRENDVTGPIMDTVVKWRHMETLDMFSTLLTGSVPTEIGSLTHLKKLRLTNSLFHGAIPEEISRLTKLTQLFWSGPNWESTVPGNLSLLTDMEVLSFEGRGFSGTIPTTLGALTKLGTLALIQTNMGGPIPSELGMFTAMTNLNLSGSYFTGTIPTELGKLTILADLLLFANDLSGSVPEGVCHAFITIDCNIECSCCTEVCHSG